MQQVWGAGCPASPPTPTSFYSSSPALVALSPSNFQPSSTCGSLYPKRQGTSEPLQGQGAPLRPSGEVLGGLGLSLPRTPPRTGPPASAAATATGPEICDSQRTLARLCPRGAPAGLPAVALAFSWRWARFHTLPPHRPFLSPAGLMAPPRWSVWMSMVDGRWSMVDGRVLELLLSCPRARQRVRESTVQGMPLRVPLLPMGTHDGSTWAKRAPGSFPTPHPLPFGERRRASGRHE